MNEIARKPRPMLSLGTGTVAYATGLKLVEGLSFDEWRDMARKLATFANGSAWWIGDWINYGEEAYGEKYQEALALTDLDYQTLRDYSWVAGSFDLSRRRDNLSFSHHREVAGRDAAEQDRWLDQAETGQWTREELRAAVRGRLEPPPERTTVTLEQLRITVPPDRAERWRRAEEASGTKLAEIVAPALDAWADDVLSESAA